MQAAYGVPILNDILNGITASEFDGFRSDLRRVPLRQKQVLHEPGTPFRYVHFVESGLASVVAVMKDGRMVEVRMVGREGLTGISHLLGAELSTLEVLVQVPGSALRIDAALFRAVFDRRESVRRLVLRFINDALVTAAQSAACNRLHSMEQRCARWLLMASDKVGSDTLPITHDLLSKMLGVRRAGVTATALKLQRSGLLDYRRGHLKIANRPALEECACECYQLDHARMY